MLAILIIDNLLRIKIFEKIVKDPYGDTAAGETVALTGVENEHFPKLKEWIQDTLKEAEVCVYCHGL